MSPMSGSLPPFGLGPLSGHGLRMTAMPVPRWNRARSHYEGLKFNAESWACRRRVELSLNRNTPQLVGIVSVHCP